MPGISFIYSLNGNIQDKKASIGQALDSIIEGRKNYQKEVVCDENNYVLALTKYPEYPVRIFNNEEFYICLEGYIYGENKNNNYNVELNTVAKNLFKYDSIGIEYLTNWLLNIDGDFVIFILHKKSNRIAIFNDALCRLPIYYYELKGEILVSRELRFIANLINDIKFDRMALAQHLLFTYPLGKRTLIENVDRLQEGSLIVIDSHSSKINKYKLHQFNLEYKKYKHRSIEENSNELMSLFCDACKNRQASNPENKNILLLSGGLDSRTVAAGFHKCGIPLLGVTFYAPQEESIAREVAQALNMDHWRLFCPPPRRKQFLKLLQLKHGLNTLAASWLIPYLEKIQEIYGSKVNLYMGLFGERLLPDQRPTKKLYNLDDLVNYLAFKNRLFKLDSVVTLIEGITKEEILEEIKNHILSYPEEDPNQKYVHFRIERSFKRFFEAEDRNRCYFWSATPFTAIKFFSYAMNCPDEQKSMYRLYREVLLKLVPEAAAIDYANRKASITSIKFKTDEFIAEYLPAIQKINLKIERNFKKIFGRKGNIKLTSANSILIECLGKQIKNCDAVNDYISNKAIQNIIDNHSQYTQEEIAFLLTVTSAIENFVCNTSTFKEDDEPEFI